MQLVANDSSKPPTIPYARRPRVATNASQVPPPIPHSRRPPNALAASSETRKETTQVSLSKVTLYRLHSAARADHFYTTHAGERDLFSRHCGYKYEAPAAQILASPAESTVPLFRILRNKEHFYTTDVMEKDEVLRDTSDAAAVHYEGVAGYVYPIQLSGTIPLYRLYRPQVDNHFYTTSKLEKRLRLKVIGWMDEGTACYVYPITKKPPHVGGDGVEARPTKVSVYRLYSKARREHLYTASMSERDMVVRDRGYQHPTQIGEIFASPAKDTVPLFRLFRNGEHFYTTDAAERECSLLHGAQDQGVLGYVYSNHVPGTIALYRLYQPTLDDHFYMTSVGVKKLCVSAHGWQDEGIACYIFPTQADTTY